LTKTSDPNRYTATYRGYPDIDNEDKEEEEEDKDDSTRSPPSKASGNGDKDALRESKDDAVSTVVADSEEEADG
jgi:hypothetical protein